MREENPGDTYVVVLAVSPRCVWLYVCVPMVKRIYCNIISTGKVHPDCGLEHR